MTTGRKDVHDPARIPQIIGIENPFETIRKTAEELLDKEIPFEGTRKALEASASIAEIQGKAVGELVDIISLNPGKIVSDFAEGIHAIKDEEIAVPRNAFVGLSQELLEALGIEENDLIDITDKVVELAGGEKIMSIPYSAFTDEMMDRLSEDFGEKATVTEAALNAAWQVVLTNIASEIHPHVTHERWDEPVCPVCGAKPEMGKFAAPEGHKFLSCPQCLTLWRHDRLKCPWCGEDNHKQLGYFTAEEYPGYRVDFCKTCNGYLKIAVEKNLNRDFVPVVDHLNTLELDIQARNEGFEVPE